MPGDPLSKTMPPLEDLVQRLSETEGEIESRFAGEIDSVVLAGGHTYLLHEAREALSATLTATARLAAIVEGSADAIIGEDPGGIVTNWNAGAEKIYGLTAQEAVGHPIEEIVPAEREDERREILERVRRGESVAHFERVRRRSDGRRMILSVTSSPIKDGAGRVIGISKVARDITEEKEREQALLLRERALGEVSQGVLFCDPRRRIVYANAGFEAITGYRQDEILGRSCTFLHGPLTDPAVQGELRTALNAGRPFDGEVLNYRKDGTTFWNDLSITALRDEAGEVVSFVGIQRDITERREAETALRETFDRLRVATRAAQAGIWELNFATRAVTWDDQMFPLFGEPADTTRTVEDIWRESVSESDRERCLAIEEEIRRGDSEAFDYEFSLVRRSDGCVRAIRSIGVVKRDARGTALRLIGSNRDVTAERERERQLSRALAGAKELARAAEAGNRAKSEFLAAMSHEIRTPMNGILGFSELLTQDESLSAESRGYVHTILGSGEALLRILDDVLDFSRLEAGRLTIEKVAVSPAAVVEDVVAFFGPQIRGKGLELRAAVSADVPACVWADPGRVRQIMVNLMGNAMKFTEAGGIDVGVRRRGERLEFFVRDSGVGIAAERIATIFEAFTQVDSSRSRRHGGTGLGLTISRRLAGLMGGELAVQSRLGEGSEFSLLIPIHLASKPGGEEAEPAPAPAASATLRVLVVEDDKVNLKLLANLVSKLGCILLTATSGTEAVRVYRETRPECVFMDVQMPEMDGIEATRRIREIEAAEGWPPAYISALTADILLEDRNRCFEAGMDFYLNKPAKRQAIADVLARAAARLRG